MNTSGLSMLNGASAAALAGALICASATCAQTAPVGEAPAGAAATSGIQTGEIMVTARKRVENLIDVPIAIESYNAVQLEKSGATGLRDLAALTPGLTFQDVNGAYASPVIRGMEQVDQTSLQGNVGVFIDGVYLNNRSGLEFGLLDIDRIEVDKGPQSALYGRNTFSGAINYLTPIPTLGVVKGYASAEVGDYGRQTYQGAVNVPIGDIAALRIFGGYGKFNGTILNIRDQRDIGGFSGKQAYGGSFIIKPTNDLTVRIYAAQSKINQSAIPLYSVPISQNNCGATSVRPNGVFNTLFCGVTPKVSQVNVNDSVGQGTSGNTQIAYVQAEQNLHFATLTGTLSYEKGKFSNLIDTTADPNAINVASTAFPGFSNQSYVSSVTPYSKDTSLDIRLASPAGQAFTWLLGFYGYDSDLINATQVSHQLIGQPNQTPVVFSNTGGELKSHGRAVYGLLGYDFSKKLDVTAELRYTHESQNFSGVGSYATALVNGVVTPVVGAQSFDLFSPRFTANYKFEQDLVGYGSVARGVKTGGFNSNGFTTGNYFQFKPESNWTYELGVKTALLDRKLRLNADIFYVDSTNVQGQRYIPGSIVSIVTNLGGATSKGVEGDASYFFTPFISMRATASYVDPKYKAGFIDGDVSAACGDYTGTTVTNIQCSDNVGGNQMARTSKFQGAVSGNWTIPEFYAGFGAYVQGDYSYQSGKYTDGLQNSTQGAISLTNIRIGVTKGPFELAFWVKNLFDVNYVDRVTIAASTADGAPKSGIDYIRVYPGEARTLGGRLDYRF